MVCLLACNARDNTIRHQAAERTVSAGTAGSLLFIPASAHVTGALGTNWRTDLEVHNPGASQASFTLALLERDKGNPSPATVSFTLGPGRSVRYEDVLDSLFHFTGAAAIRISITAGMAAFTSRTFNQTPGGTYGQFIGGVLESTAIRAGEEGRIIQITHNRSSSSGFRTNIGFVNATGSSLTLRIDLYTSEGTYLGTRSYTLAPYEFRQVDKIFEKVTGSDVADGYAVLSTDTSGGAFFAYASVVDNRTGDPVFITPSVRRPSGPPPAPPSGTPTATPTPTPTVTPTPTGTPPAGNPNLKPYQPSGWSGPLVVSGTTGTSTSGGLVGGQPTYFDWAMANYGPGDVVFPPGSHLTQIQLDGSPAKSFYTQDGYTLPEGYFAYYEDDPLDGIPAGQHTARLVADPDPVVAESDESDNTFDSTLTWSAASAPAGAASATWHAVPAVPKTAPIPGWRPPGAGSSLVAGSRSVKRAVVVGDPVYVPASAHVSGALGTDWRTDLELHNPGTATATYRIDLLKRDQDNSNPQSRTFTVQGGHSLRLVDVLWSQFGFSGAAALRIVPESGEVIVTSRTFNLTPGGTYGQFIAGVRARTELAAGERAVQIQLSHVASSSSGFRTNLGLVNLTGSSITLQVELKGAGGTSYGSLSYTLKPYEYKQIDKIFEKVTGSAVDDGYAVITSSTGGARYLAYASIIDNRTGDPVFAPAIPVLDSAPAPVELTEAAYAIFVGLGAMGQGTVPSLEQMVSGIQQVGMEGFLDELVSAYPDVVSRIPMGIRADYGGHYVLDDGSVISGSLTLTYSNLVNTSSNFAFDYTLTQDEFGWKGSYAQVDLLNGAMNMSVDSGHATGNITMNGSGTAAAAPGAVTPSITGTAVFDTAVCPNYPIDGSVTATDDTGTTTINFNDRCDGTFDTSNPPPSRELTFRLSWQASEEVDLDLRVKDPNDEIVGESLQGCQPPEETVTLSGQAAIPGIYSYGALWWDHCGASADPPFDYTFEVFEDGVLKATRSGSMTHSVGWFTYAYNP